MTALSNTSQRTGRPRSTGFTAAQIVLRNYRVDPKTGRIYNRNGVEVGSSTYEPRVTVHLENGKKYNPRVNKIVALVRFGPEAFRRGVSVIHKNGNKFDNRQSNLSLRYNRAAQRAYNRLLAA